MLNQESIDAKLNQWTGLVHKVVLKHFNKHHTQYKEYDELINIGLFGLYNAIIPYDKDKGASEMAACRKRTAVQTDGRTGKTNAVRR